jgi:Family of unknown function (DUF6163)
MSREFFQPSAAQTPRAAISLKDRAQAGPESNRAGSTLVLFMRVLAGLCAAQGLIQWSAILLPSESLFDNLPPLRGAAVIYFAVLDLVAAAGLWLATPWGGVIWLLGAFTQFFAAFALPGFFSIFSTAANIALIAIYLALSWKAGHPNTTFLKLHRSRRER